MPDYTGSYATPRLDLGVAFNEFVENPSEFIARFVLAGFGVARKAGTFSKLERASFLRRGNVKRVARANYNRDQFSATDQAYACEERGQEVPLDDSERALYANDFDAELASTRTAARRVLQEIEIDVATAIFNTTTWTGSSLYTDVATTWATVATADVIGDVQAAKEKVRRLTGLEPNTLIVGAANLPYLINNAAIRNSIGYAQGSEIPRVLASLPAILGIERILVGKGVYNSAKEGATAVIADIWSSGYAMVAKLAMPGEGLDTPCVGRTLVWTADSPVEAGGAVVELYRAEEQRSDIVRARVHQDELVVDASYGHLLKVD